MAEYNPSKIIKDGNTYNFRDTTKIPLAGSNEISGSLIPSTDGTVNLGSPSYQWNNAYIKSLTINGVACGNILTHNVSEFVGVSGNQTIGGQKIFSTSPRVTKTFPDIALNISDCDVTEIPTEAKYASLYFRDKNNKNLAYIVGQQRVDGTKRMCIRTHRTNDIDAYYSVNLDSNGNFYPEQNNAINLGSSTAQWNNAYIKSLTINGVAAGDILTHNANEFVSVTGAQTIGGVKTFSDIPIVASGKTYVSQIKADRINGTLAGFSAYNGFKIVCNNDSQGWDNTAFAIHMPEYSPTRAAVGFKLFDCIEGSSSYKGFGFSKNGNDFQLFPTASNAINLGSPSSQWNTTYTRNMLIDNDINIASSLINKTSTSGTFSLRSGTNYNDGASITLYGKDYNGGLAGQFTLYAYGNSDYTYVRIYPNGIMTVYNNSTNTTKNIAMQEDVIPRSGGAVMTGDLLASSTINSIGFGYGWGNGGTIYTYSPIHSTVDWQGTIRLEPLKTTSNFKTMQLAPGGTWTWSGTACQITSDQRYKQQITEIDDKLLDAWEDVELVQFKYNESVDTKGKSARLHTGYVVQQIDSACKSHGVDISEYGLYCHEEYPEETKEVEVEQADGTKTKETKVIREANEHYSLRYTEALIVECKYLRRCIARLTARIEELEKGNNSK